MQPLVSKRYYFILALFGAGFIVIGCRLICLGYYKSDFSNFLETSRHRLRTLPASRGKIIDCKGRCLAMQQKVYDVGVDLTQINITDKIFLPRLAHFLEKPLNTLEALCIKSDCRWKSLKNDVSEFNYRKIKALKIRGVYGNEKQQRTYLHAPSLSYVVGFVNKEGTAVCGVEKIMNFYLSGQNGFLSYEIDGKNQELAQHRKCKIDPINGYTVELTIDDQVQRIAEKVIVAAAEKYTPQSIQALITRPNTGEILALVNWPFFDSNRYNQYPLDLLNNRAVTNIYEPGSVFKAITISAALDCNAVKPNDTFDCRKNKSAYRGKNLPLPQDWKPFNQSMNIAEILSNSSNRGTVQVALQMGEEKLYKYVRNFGFGESTLSGFQGETKGILHPIKHWDGLTITRLPIGHSLACSLFQMHYAMGAIANGGTLFYPQWIHRIYNTKGEIIRSFLPHPRRQVIKNTTSQTMRAMLLLSEHSKAYIPNYNVTGKTGTSQKIIQGRYSHNQHIASFSGFFPNQNPQIEITITVDSPKTQGTAYGSVVAAPIFKEIAEDLITYMGIQPEPKLL